MRRLHQTAALGVTALALHFAAAPAGPAFGLVPAGRIGPSLGITSNGRLLHPFGHLTQVGNFPTGGALTPDGRFLWVIDAGFGRDDVRIIRVSSRRVVETLPLAGTFGGVAFTPDGRHAYVSGLAAGIDTPDGELGASGNVLHVFDVDRRRGMAVERSPVALPSSSGAALIPDGVAVSADGRFVAAALLQANEVAILDRGSGAVQEVSVGSYPEQVVFDRRGRLWVSNAFDGTLSVVDPVSSKVIATVPGLGGVEGDYNSQPEGLAVDPKSNRLFVAVAQRDLVAVIDTDRMAAVRTIAVGRPGDPAGVEPTALTVSPDGSSLYVADSNEDAIAVISLTNRPRQRPRPHRRHQSGYIPGLPTYTVIGKLPTASYPTVVAITPNGRRLEWIAAKGLGAGPNPRMLWVWASAPSGWVPPRTPYGTYDEEAVTGYVGSAPVPSDRQVRFAGRAGAKQAVPANYTDAPAGTPVRPDGPIQHVFYVIKENRTYDQIFGSTGSRGDGDPRLELFDDNGVAGPAGGVTPNAHALARRFGLLDHFFGDSEVSSDGHLIAATSIANDYDQRSIPQNYAGRGNPSDGEIQPITLPPPVSVFDQAAREGVSFRDYGEPLISPTLAQSDPADYPQVLADSAFIPTGPDCVQSLACIQDSGIVDGRGQIIGAVSRIDAFQAMFQSQVASSSVPAFNYITLSNDHTLGTTTGSYSPKAMIADNDLALGQLIELISHSPIWSSSAILVEEDDSQDGADHVDAHRMPAYVISPYARGGVISTRYDQYSMLRTAEIIAGIKPLTIDDALATPMYSAFITGNQRPDLTPYTAVIPTQPLSATNSASSADADLSDALPFNRLDAVPQAVMDQILWASVYGSRPAPKPGPHASSDELGRAIKTLAAIEAENDTTGHGARLVGGHDDPTQRSLSPVIRAAAKREARTLLNALR